MKTDPKSSTYVKSMASDPSIRRITVPAPGGFKKFLEQSPPISKEAIRATQALLRAT